MTEPPSRRRVLFLVGCYVDPYGGTEGQIHALLEGLRASGDWEAEMWVLQPSRWLVENPFPCPTRNLGLTSLARPLSFVRIAGLARQVRRRHFDLIQTYMPDASLLGAPLGFLARVPVLIARRDLGFWQTPTWLEALRRTDRLTQGVIANCDAVARHTVASEQVPPALVSTVPNGHDPARFTSPPEPGLRERLGLPERAPVVGLLANVKPLKRHDDLLAALRELSGDHAHAHALCIGEPVVPDVPLEEKARRQGLEGRVHRVEAPGNAIGVLKHADVGVLCSETEGLSNAILEYMGCGLPVVATNVGGNPELVVDGQTGFLYEPGDVDALAAHLGRLLADPALARRLGAKGRARFEQGYTQTAMVEGTTACWERAAARPVRPEGGNLEWEVVAEPSRLEALAEPWAALLSPHDFFLGPDWVLARLDPAEEAEVPHVLVARRRDGRLAGVLPLARRAGGVLAFVGAGLGADHLDVVAAPEDAVEVARSALAFVLGQRWTRLHLPHLKEDAALRVALRDRPWVLSTTERLSTVCPYLGCEGAYDDYVKRHFSYASRRNVRRYPKRFRQLEGARVERIRDPREAAAGVDRFYALHRKRFATREETSDLDHPALQAFHRRLAVRAANSGSLALTFLVLGDVDVASEYAFRHGNKLYAFQSGFDSKAPFESPGLVLQAIVVKEDVFGRGLDEYDFLDGSEAYKLRWATGERRLYDADVFRPTPLGWGSAAARGVARIAYDSVRGQVNESR